MPLRTKRWNDPAEADDGFRVLVCRYRPRGVSKAREAWDEWWPDLGPSRALHAAYWGKDKEDGDGAEKKAGKALPWREYRLRYLEEMQRQRLRLGALASRHAAGETITLLCSSACEDPERCHRTVLAELVSGLAARRPAARR